MGICHRIFDQLVDSYEVNLSGNNGELQIHMIIRGEFRILEETIAATEEGGMWRSEHFGEIIGLIGEELTCCWWGSRKCRR